MTRIARILDIEAAAHFSGHGERIDRNGRKIFVWQLRAVGNDLEKLEKDLRAEFDNKMVRHIKSKKGSPTMVELILPITYKFSKMKIEFIDDLVAFPIVCKAKKKWGIYFSFLSEDMLSVDNAAPWLKNDKSIQCVADGHGIALFDTEADMLKAYESTVGDDGPTVSNPYRGHVRVYALTCNPKGVTLNENT